MSTILHFFLFFFVGLYVQLREMMNDGRYESTTSHSPFFRVTIGEIKLLLNKYHVPVPLHRNRQNFFTLA